MGTECLRWASYSSSVSASVLQFWEDVSQAMFKIDVNHMIYVNRLELFTDVTVAVPGGTAVAAHRAVLAARSGELRRLLVSAGEVPPLLLLRGVTAGQLRLLLQLFYTGRVQASRQQLHELLGLCRDLEVEGVDGDALSPLEDGQQPCTEPAGAAFTAHSQPAWVTFTADSQPTEGGAAAAAACAGFQRSGDQPSRAGSCGASTDPPRSYTPVTDRVDSESDGEPAGRLWPDGELLSPRRTSCAAEGVGSPERPTTRWAECGDVGSATFRHFSSLLDSLERRELVQLKERAEQIMYPDCTAWLPDEILVNILSRLPPRDLLLASGTCRRWQALSEDDCVWRRCVRLCRAPGAAGTSIASRQNCRNWLGWTEQPLMPPKRLKGHESVIRCMAVDGDRIVTGSSDKTVGIWSAASGQLTCRLRVESEVTCVQVEGDTVVTAAARDYTLGVWDACSGRRRHRLRGHDGIVWSVALHGGRAASGSDDKTARFWDVRSGRQETVLRGHETVVRAVCFDGRWLVSGDDAGCVQVWSADTRTVESVWRARSRHVMVLQHGCGMVVSGHGDGAVNVWDMATRQLRYELRAHTGWVTDICIREGLLLTGCKDGSALLWRLVTGAPVHRLCGATGHRQRVTAVRLLAGLAVTGSRDGRVKLWDTGSGALLRDLVTPEVSGGPVKHVWVAADRLVCGAQNNASDRPQVLVFEMALRRGSEPAAAGR